MEAADDSDSNPEETAKLLGLHIMGGVLVMVGMVLQCVCVCLPWGWGCRIAT